MKTDFVRPLGRGLMVARPNGRQYGHLALEMLMALSAARRENAAVCFLPPRKPVSAAFFDLESTDVRIVHPGLLSRLWLRCAWAADAIPPDLRVRRDRALEALYHEVGIELSRHVPDMRYPEPLRDRLRKSRGRIGRREKALRQPALEQPPYFRRRAIAECVAVALRPAVQERTRKEAAAIGIPADGRVVTIHAREAGFKRGMEVQEKHRRLGKGRTRDDETRNARIEDCGLAADLL